MESIYEVSYSLVEIIAKLTNLDVLNNNKVPDTFVYDGKLFIPVGSVWSGNKGCHNASAYEVIPIDKYKGSVKPMYQYEHYNLVLEGKRERGYNARLLKKGNANFVMIDPKVTFIPLEEPKQLSIF